MERLRSSLVTLSVLVTFACGARAWGDPVEVTIAQGGKATREVIVGSEATERTRSAAADLADYLGRMSGGEFVVRIGDGTEGLAVGAYGDFPDLVPDVKFQTEDPFRQDDYVLRTHAEGVYLIGTSDAAVHLAVWDFLHRLGYRLYFLTDTWEVVPDRPSLSAALDAVERPDYVTRRAPRGAPWSDRELWNRWRQRNRVNSSFSLSTGHAYGGIVKANKEAFDAHPEYFALVDGERRKGGNAKFCVSNPGLRQLVVDHGVGRMKANPGRDSISMDPSDGGGWCECEDCLAMGSVSDRALTLANEVAEAINELGLGPKYVGMYGYNQHSPPPNIQVHANVVISVATAFIRGGHTVEELVEGWRTQGATLGIRDYHDVFPWSHDGPRDARGGNVEYLTRTIPYFHEQGARFMNSENADSWGANGLGYWLTPRLLWDVDNVERVDMLIEDFLDNAFGSAKEPMREFHQLLNRDPDSVRSNEDVVARMYRRLDDARKLTSDPDVRARLNDLILYTRYLDLYHDYRAAEGEARQAGFEQVWRHVYRMRHRMMLSTVAICHRDQFRDSSVEVPEEAKWSVPERENPWKSGKPFNEREITHILKVGIAANEPTVLSFKAKEYSEELVPAVGLQLPEVSPGDWDDRYRGRQKVYTWLPEDRKEIRLKVTGGLIKHYRDRGNVRFALYAAKEATLDPVDRDESVPPDGKEREVVLTSPYSGLHRLQWNDGSDMTRVVWPEGLPFTIRSTLEDQMRLRGRWDLYFYVPPGTKVVGGYTSSTVGRLLDGDGNEVFDFSQMAAAGYFSVDVAEGQDGMPWEFDNSRGQRMLMTVPPYMAPSGKQLLLPREVVEGKE
ncbi:MAG: DUF4838 domain-containing protein [Planctomycetota bacterium]